MNNFIYPCLTLKGKIAEASQFYIDTFGEGKITQTSPFVILLELSGQKFMLLNDGPSSTPNASTSFMVTCETPGETEQYWQKLIAGGKVFMSLAEYPWSTKYGWVEDKFGVSWQLFTGSKSLTPQKYAPSLLFTGASAGKAKEAIHFYTNLFPKSDIESVVEYTEDDQDQLGFIKHARFHIYEFMTTAMDSSASLEFKFNDAISFVVTCDSQEEIDNYWDHLTADGGKEVACGWLVDKFGVSWQIIPGNLGQLMSHPENGQKAMAALRKMKKLIIADLKNA